MSMWGQCGVQIVVEFSCRLSTLLTSKLATEGTWKGERGRGTLPKLQLKRVGRHAPNKGSRQLACPPCLFQIRRSCHDLCQPLKRHLYQVVLHLHRLSDREIRRWTRDRGCTAADLESASPVRPIQVQRVRRPVRHPTETASPRARHVPSFRKGSAADN